MAEDTSIEQAQVPLYEREVQAYLANNLGLLGEPDLFLIQMEYPVKFGSDEGRIDILAKDAHGSICVIEVKRGVAGRSAVGQLQSYMGAILLEFPEARVTGILVASDLDAAAKSALLVSQIKFYKFTTRFDFEYVKSDRPTYRSDPKLTVPAFKENYWEQLGGTLSDEVAHCIACKTDVRTVVIGSSKLCGNCGRVI